METVGATSLVHHAGPDRQRHPLSNSLFQTSPVSKIAGYCAPFNPHRKPRQTWLPRRCTIVKFKMPLIRALSPTRADGTTLHHAHVIFNSQARTDF
jgi:hypothetical protein